jgi:hypothetical protein
MNSSNDQLKIKYSETDKQPKSVKLISLFLILIFAIVPLAEIVTDLDYNHIVYSNPKIFCGLSIIDNYEVLSFKPLE